MLITCQVNLDHISWSRCAGRHSRIDLAWRRKERGMRTRKMVNESGANSINTNWFEAKSISILIGEDQPQKR